MSFTQVTVTGTVNLSNDVPADGASVTFTLNTPITDGSQLVAPEGLTARCNSSGVFSIVLNANDDTTTLPQGSYYEVVISYGGAVLDSFNVIVPHGGGSTVQLFELATVSTAPPGVIYVSQLIAGGGITLSPAGGTGAVTITAGVQPLTPTALKTAAYTAAPNDFVLANINGGNVPVTLPAAPADKTRVGIKVVKISGSPGSTNATLVCGGSDVFNIAAGSTTLTFTALFQGVTVQYEAAGGVWVVQNTDTPLGSALGAAKLGTDGTVGGPSGSPLTPSVVTDSSATPKSIDSTGVTGGNALLYDTGSGKWKPGSPGAAPDHTDTPVADTSAGSPGTSTLASAADHSHPMSLLGRMGIFGAFPPNLAFDVTLDGTWNGAFGTPFGWWPVTSGTPNSLGKSGNIYTLPAGNGSSPSFLNHLGGIFARNITLNAGITLKPNSGSNPVILVASQTITINGTIDASGNAAAGATGGAGNNDGNSSRLQGGPGANGGTGAGAGGANPYNSAQGGSGGSAGNGGASGATAGGAGATLASFGGGGFFPLGLAGFYMWNVNGANFTMPGGGSGAGSGAGDGTNAGGGGGGGAGHVILIAPKIILGAAAIVRAKGGAGAAGVAGNAGGGGGGGGGLISMHALQVAINGTATVDASGGAAGAGAGTGSAGVAGSKSAFFSDPPIINGGFGFGDGCLICQWQ